MTAGARAVMVTEQVDVAAPVGVREHVAWLGDAPPELLKVTTPAGAD